MTPASPSARIHGFDCARALAVFGMVIVNFKVAMGASQRGPEWLCWIAGRFDGRAAATFVVLAGIGISLMTRAAWSVGEPEARRVGRRRLLKRAAFLLVVGLLYLPIWPGDILHYYGLYLGLAAFLITTSSSKLWTLAGLGVVGFVGLILVFDYERGWDFATLEYHDLWTPAGMLRNAFFNGFHPVIPWIAFLLVGMAVGRLDWSLPRVRRRILLAGIFAAVLGETASWLCLRAFTPGLAGKELEVVQAVFTRDSLPPMPLYMLAGTGTALAVISLSVSAAVRWRETRGVRALAATGQLALTHYVAHVILGMGLLEVLGRFEGQDLVFALGAAAVFSVFAVGFSLAWRARFSRGPLEALMRRITG